MDTKRITALAGAVIAVGLATAAGANAQSSKPQTVTPVSQNTVTQSNLRHNTIKNASRVQIPHSTTPPTPSQVIHRTSTVTPTHSTSPKPPVPNENKPKLFQSTPTG